MKINAYTNTIVRNGEDVVRFCLSSILPYVEKAIVTIDSRSNDNTRGILKEMKKEFPNLEVDEYEVRDPVKDLVIMRNLQLLKSKGKWVWIVDSDEYYPKDTMDSLVNILNFEENDYDVYALKCWAIWDKEKGHKSSSKAVIPRIFRKDYSLFWKGNFGREKLYKGSVSMCA